LLVSGCGVGAPSKAQNEADAEKQLSGTYSCSRTSAEKDHSYDCCFSFDGKGTVYSWRHNPTYFNHTLGVDFKENVTWFDHSSYLLSRNQSGEWVVSGGIGIYTAVVHAGGLVTVDKYNKDDAFVNDLSLAHMLNKELITIKKESSQVISSAGDAAKYHGGDCVVSPF
jgi:hypothetical protein